MTQFSFTDGQLVYHRYRPYRWTRFLGGLSLCPCNNANYLSHERILHIYRSCIHFSIRTDGQLRFTDGKLVYHRYLPYRTDGQGFWGATLCPCNNANYLIHERILHIYKVFGGRNNANYLIHERILHIYRSCINFSICTDGHGW